MGRGLVLVLCTLTLLVLTAQVIGLCRSPNYGDSVTYYPTKKYYSLGQSITLKCKHGYTLGVLSMRVCSRQGWFPNTLPLCKPPSCLNICGTKSNSVCSCHYSCKTYENCCDDYDHYCDDINPPETLHSCRYHCGMVGRNGCNCDSSCLYYDDCCGDYLNYCYEDDKKEEEEEDDKKDDENHNKKNVKQNDSDFGSDGSNSNDSDKNSDSDSDSD